MLRVGGRGFRPHAPPVRHLGGQGEDALALARPARGGQRFGRAIPATSAPPAGAPRQRVAQARSVPGSQNSSRRQLLAMRLDEGRMAERDRQDRDLARRVARPAAELGLRRERRLGEAERGARAAETAAPRRSPKRRRARRSPGAFGRGSSPKSAEAAPLHVGLRSGGAASRRRSPPTASARRRSSAARAAPACRSACPSVSRVEQHVGERPRALEHLGHRRRAARADEVVRVLPLGQKREAQALSRPDQRQRGLDGPEGGACRPALSPSKQRIGSPAIAHSSAHWSAVSAVPSGATTLGKPASLSAIAST